MLEDCLEARFEFTGCKIALICDGQILTILRDDKEDIPGLICGNYQVVVGKEMRHLLSVWRVRFMRN